MLDAFQRSRHAAIAARHASAESLREGFVLGLSVSILCVLIGYMFVGDRPFQPDLLASSEISPINRWMWLGMFGSALPVLWLRRQDVVRLVPAIWPLLLLYVWFLLSTGWALDRDASTRRAILSCLTLVVCIAVTVGLRTARRIHLIACLPCILVVSIDLASWGIVPGLAMSRLGLQGLHAQKNMLGMYSMYTLIAAATAAFVVQPGWPRRLLLGGAAISAVTLLASRSGTSIQLVLAACAILPPLVYLLRHRPVVIAGVLLTLLLLIGGVFAAYLAWCGVTAADPLAPLAGVTLTQRTDLWAFIIENIHKRPWGGAGYGSFWAIDKAVQPSLHSGLWFGMGKEIAPEGHDAYLDLAVTTGLIGLALGLFVLLRTIVRAGAAVNAAGRAGGMALPTAAFHLAFCLMVAGHSVTESTLYAPDSQLGTLFILAAVSLEWARLARMRPWQQAAARRPAPFRASPRRPAGPAMQPAPAQR